MSVVIDTVTAADPAAAPMPVEQASGASPAPARSAKPDLDAIRHLMRRDDERLRRLWAD